MPVHKWTAETEALAREVLAYTQSRLHLSPVPLDGPRSLDELGVAAGETITTGGLGGAEALRLFTDVLAPACISIDHPRYFAFIPCAPTPAAMLFDLVVGASSIYGGSWLEGAGAVFAENQALRWLADLAGLGQGAGGVFVQGGTLGNVSALIAARHSAARLSDKSAHRFGLVASSEAHSSVRSAAHAMDVDVVPADTDQDGRLTGDAVQRAIDANSASRRPRD
ncbi:MAG: pyridoxal-dependent decarboxylase, partial [Acidimicrobiales bacterium]